MQNHARTQHGHSTVPIYLTTRRHNPEAVFYYDLFRGAVHILSDGTTAER
jgi:hypothetical protein